MSEKDAYVEKMKAKLDEWNAEIDKLQAKAKQAEADAEIQYNDEISALIANEKCDQYCPESLKSQPVCIIQLFDLPAVPASMSGIRAKS